MAPALSTAEGTADRATVVKEPAESDVKRSESSTSSRSTWLAGKKPDCPPGDLPKSQPSPATESTRTRSPASSDSWRPTPPRSSAAATGGAIKS